MMENASLSELIWMAVKNNIKVQTCYVTIVSVDKDKDVCEGKKLDDETPITNIKLKAINDSTDTKIVKYPQPESVALVSIIGNDISDTYLTAISEVESIKIMLKDVLIMVEESKVSGVIKDCEFLLDGAKTALKVKDCELTMDGAETLIKVKSSMLSLKDGAIKFNDGSFDGLVKVAAAASKISALEGKVNDLITACKSVIVTLAPSGTFPLASFFSSVNPIAPTTQKSDLENPKIKH